MVAVLTQTQAAFALPANRRERDTEQPYSRCAKMSGSAAWAMALPHKVVTFSIVAEIGLSRHSNSSFLANNLVTGTS